jgi:pimeloyl-ACP methyl ester carboxylesterase
MPFKEETVSVRDGMFSVQTRRGGSGEPLLFLHGAGGAPATAEPWLEALAQRYEVIVPSHPGWGDSTGIDHLDDVIDMALFYHDYIDALGLASVNVMGTSLGGMFAAEVAAISPSYVKKLVLVDPAGLWLDEAPMADFFIMSPKELGEIMWADPEAAAARMPQIDPEDREAQAKAMLTREKAMSATGKFIWPIADKGLKKRIHRIKAPTLIIWGEKDGLIPPVYGPLFQKSIRGSQLVTIPNAGHVPMVENPDTFVKAVSDFLG